ncbi:hypothetical protein [Gordonia effusa]|nr:hypothetical protein [Gordonia effusa]
MTPPARGRTEPGSISPPEPPYPPELLADLHADVLPPDVATHIRARIADDPVARETLASLDRTQLLLRELPVVEHEVRPAVRAATDRTLATVAADVADRNHRVAGPHRRISLVATAASVLVVAALALSIWQITRPDAATPPDVGSDITLSSNETIASLALLGRVSGAPFADTRALRRCTAANGVPESTAIVGYGPVQVRQRTAVMILLATGIAGRFDVLLVGAGCDTGTPTTIARSTIGA